MIKFLGFDENGEAIYAECKTRLYYELPKKGLGKSMEPVGINEPVIFRKCDFSDELTFGYSDAEIDRRAYELNAEIKWMELPPKHFEDINLIQMWFSKKTKS